MTNLIQFLIRAKRNTYAGGGRQVESSRLLSKDLRYTEGDFEYLDSYFGSYTFSGQEIVYYQNKPIWSMNYYGKNTDKNQNAEVLSILKESLMLVNEEMPYRGPKKHMKGDFLYSCKADGDISDFRGEEKLIKNDETIYTLEFHGGYIK